MRAFVLVVRVDDAEEVRYVVNIAAQYNLEYTLALKQIYLFIPNTETLIKISQLLKDDKP